MFKIEKNEFLFNSDKHYQYSRISLPKEEKIESGFVIKLASKSNKAPINSNCMLFSLFNVINII